MDEEQDSLKEAMLDTNPYLLGMTFIVSVVHSIFEFLAFKNGNNTYYPTNLSIIQHGFVYFSSLDIQFWRQRESLEGLSVRSVFFNVFQSLIVLLYVLDNETNTLIRISCFIGLGIEVWKIHKVSPAFSIRSGSDILIPIILSLGRRRENRPRESRLGFLSYPLC